MAYPRGRRPPGTDRNIPSVIRWIRAGEIGELTPRRTGSSLGAHEGFIVGLVEERKDITLNEMVERLAAERALQCDRL